VKAFTQKLLKEGSFDSGKSGMMRVQCDDMLTEIRRGLCALQPYMSINVCIQENISPQVVALVSVQEHVTGTFSSRFISRA